MFLFGSHRQLCQDVLHCSVLRCIAIYSAFEQTGDWCEVDTTSKKVIVAGTRECLKIGWQPPKLFVTASAVHALMSANRGSGRATLIHCQQGTSADAECVVHYSMRRGLDDRLWQCDAVLAFVKYNQPVVDNHDGFTQWLGTEVKSIAQFGFEEVVEELQQRATHDCCHPRDGT